MELYSFNQINIINRSNQYDVFIASTGYEIRASFLAKQEIKANRKIVLAFEDNKDHPNRMLNDSIFEKYNFEFIKISGSDDDEILSLFKSIVLDHPYSELSILVDYSSMTRIWYGAIIYYLSHLQIENKKIRIYFSYSVSEFTPPPQIESETFNFYPINSFCHLSLPTKPTALIAGLGYEKKRVFGLREYFDAEALFLFYTDKNSFTEYVLEKNKEVIESVKETHIFPYTLTDVTYTKMLLQDLCEELKNRFRIIIAPCGPKPFTLLSFIIASNIPNIDVWRISASDNDNLISERKENGEIITIELVYEGSTNNPS
ncbi:MAG: hypothetical protein LBI82_08565 [Dysgonamonadaceae bacterium]|jgi:hypothetical protein|nr:hypothetical protein [Dysgonamonadaceae bacterium]